MVCRGLMLGARTAPACIELPPLRQVSTEQRGRASPAGGESTSTRRPCARPALAGSRPLRDPSGPAHDDEALFDGLIEEHHYLGYTRPVGEHLKYLV